jgi:hypothetical protein
MKISISIPKELAHLKIDERGYPIPFFVAKIEGKPDFRILDAKKQLLSADQKLCAICGRKLAKDYVYFISGPMGVQNCVSSDPPMHRVCAEYSLQVCPHLYYEKAERNERGELYQKLKDGKSADFLIPDKPSVFHMVRANKWEFKRTQGVNLFHFRVASFETYSYENGHLLKN